MDERDLAMVGGHDPHAWREQMRNGYVRLHLIFALEETQVFDALRRDRGEGQTAAALAAACGLEPRVLEGALDYLAFSDVVLAKVGGRYALTEQGRAWLGADATLNLTYMMAAYAPQLERLVPALRREQRYGADFARRGELLALASARGARGTYPWIVAELRALGVTLVADLGCGAGELLVEFCALDPALRGLGVDVDPGAVEAARRNVRARRLEDRIRIVRGDLARPEALDAELEAAQAFNALGVVHELLVDGEPAVEQLFRRMKARFPGRYFFLGELDRTPDEGWAQLEPVDRIKKLHYQHVMHPMSLQGAPISRARWLALLERAGVTCLKVERFFVDEYVLRL